ncbi:putative wall-associated receptor kinase, galacturonan-binding domain-containing protein [Helianthus annuus]|nr:putative wall-associated receptor kinase, galacturonan-binding domain-containing protein [Helianthus annuus]KAJ0698798.1 putative wall-associated receptor kinase, galacturonan-binding domain-containing protein [Helianthus annuus]KAJ0877703.1 putative wall-associated receptor kinase, galacturonan-binding domain-containing protein [Helianthus annuus]KAJ0894634.1 putative wall-associated receptor kinase, galacturonan-binding domain-containing protein [Helianthus annuus]
MLLQINVILIVILSTTKATSPSQLAQSLLGCPDKCGNITIPYPFGIGKDCSLSETYEVNCTSLTIGDANFTLVNIFPEGHIHALLPVAHHCYNNNGSISHSQPKIRLSRFLLSSRLNFLTAVGCDARAGLLDLKDRNYISDCLSRTNCTKLAKNLCYGQGCMQVPLPFSLTKFRIHTQRVTRQVGSWSFNNCTYAFLARKMHYKFKKEDLDNMQNQSLEVSLVWTVGNTRCAEAKRNITSYVCRENTECWDSLEIVDEGHPGYNCRCAHGYQGNPYLPGGCQGKSCLFS